jgi:hypothetical protein
MAEGFMNLFPQEDTSGKKPHFRVLFKLTENGREVEHEAAFWPAKEGKKGFTGRFKPRQSRAESADDNESAA